MGLIFGIGVSQPEFKRRYDIDAFDMLLSISNLVAAVNYRRSDKGWYVDVFRDGATVGSFTDTEHRKVFARLVKLAIES